MGAGRSRYSAPPSLNPRQLSALKAIGPTANQILSNIDDLNEEIEEQAEARGVVLATSEQEDPRAIKPRTEPLPIPQISPSEEIYATQEPEVNNADELAAEQARLDRLLAEQQARQAAQAASEPEPEPASEEVSIEQQVLQLLHGRPNAPSAEQIAAWKQKYGQTGVQVLALGEEDVYVFTYLRRSQMKSIQDATIKQSQIEGMAKDPEEYMSEQVLKQCVLWPKLGVNFWYGSRAGVIPTLYQVIMLHSYHLTPQQAMVLTAQL